MFPVDSRVGPILPVPLRICDCGEPRLTSLQQRTPTMQVQMKNHRVTTDEQRLLDLARDVRKHAHAPYSGFAVGAAILDDRGELHVGCNVENAAYPQGSCAEQNAIGAMIAAGGRRIALIAALGGHGKLEACAPCGGCRQRILEFADDNTRVLLTGDEGDVVSYSVEALLPAGFRLRD